MNDFEIVVESVEMLDNAVFQLLQWAADEKIFCFDAPMSAGKTTFIKHLCKALKFDGLVSSPTFPIIQEYVGENFIYHIDCYRLKDVDEAIAVGLEDCLASGDFCFIEWAAMIKKILPLKRVEISIEMVNEFSRKIVAKKISSK